MQKEEENLREESEGFLDGEESDTSLEKEESEEELEASEDVEDMEDHALGLEEDGSRERSEEGLNLNLEESSLEEETPIEEEEPEEEVQTFLPEEGTEDEIVSEEEANEGTAPGSAEEEANEDTAPGSAEEEANEDTAPGRAGEEENEDTAPGSSEEEVIEQDEAASEKEAEALGDADLESKNDQEKDVEEEEQEPFIPPVMYGEQDWDRVEEHIEKYFGDFEDMLHEKNSSIIHSDICLIRPRKGRDYYTLVTLGMGAKRMEVPDTFPELERARIELLINLPPHWRLDAESLKDERWYWPVRLLRDTARLPFEENSWLGLWHSVQREDSYASNTRFNSSLLLDPMGFDKESAECMLVSGEKVHFFQLIPLYPEELKFKINSGTGELLNLFEILPEREKSIVHVDRYNVMEDEKELQKPFAIPPALWRRVLTNWNGPDRCIVSNRIMLEGCKVGYCYREEPVDDRGVWDEEDSGWTFFAGDEDAAYTENESNFGYYRLNTLCNFDPEVQEILDSPFNKAYERDEKGYWLEVSRGDTN